MKNTIFTGYRSETNTPGLRLNTGTRKTTYPLHARLRVMAAMAIVACLGLTSIYAAEYTFIGNDVNWITPENWSDGQLPGAGDTGIIAGSEDAIRTAKFYSNSELPETPDAIRILPYGELHLNFHMRNEHNLILEGGRLSIGGNYHQCHSTISLHADSFLSAPSGYSFRVFSVIKDNSPSAGRLIIDSGSISIYNETNTYSGGTVIKNDATLFLESGANKIGVGPLEIQEGGRLYYGYSSKVTLTNPITVINGKLHGYNNFHYLVAPNGVHVKGAVELYTTSGYQGLEAPLHDYDAEHPGRVVKTGSGSFTFRDYILTNNSYSGGTRIEEGTLVAYTANNTFGTGPIEVLPKARLGIGLSTTQTNSVILNGGEISLVAGNSFTTLPNVRIKGVGIISGSAPAYFNLNTALHDFDAESPGHLIISNNSVGPITLNGTHSYSGGTHIKKGLLKSDSNLPDTGMIQVDADAVLEFNKDDTIGGLEGAGSIVLGTATVTCNEGIRPGTDTLTGGTLSITGTTGRVVLGPDAVNTFYLREPGDQDQVVLQGGAELTLGGELRIEALAGITAGEYTLFALADGTTPEGAFSDLALPYNFTGSVAIIDNDVVLRLVDQGTIIIIK